ncbi:MAG: AraC family transcriptional regulator [Polyangiales bacterium]
MDAPTVSVRYILKVLEAAALRGLSAAQLCQDAGFPQPVSDDPDLRYPTAQYLKLWTLAMERVDDPAFPLAVAQLMDPASFDVLGFGVMTSKTLGDALRRVSEHLIVMTNAARWVLELGPTLATFSLVREVPFRPEHRYVDEFVLTNLVYWSRKLTGHDFAPTRIRFRHSRPESKALAVFENFFRAPIEFEHRRAEIVLQEELLGLPLLKADSAIASFFDRHTRDLIEKHHPGQTFVRSLRAAVIDALSSGSCSLTAVAERMSMSSRTMRRRLAEENVSFKTLLDDIRRQLAQEYLREGRLSIGEIAFVIGYSEPAAFHRAFYRWTGQTPTSYRGA